jgi:4-hydroxy-3-polyprenylbenzoate decarboxylase
VKALVELKYDPDPRAKSPLRYLPVWHRHVRAAAAHAGGLHRSATARRVSELPQIVNWPRDGGPFITLPQVYSEDVNAPGVMKANLGMYRIQLGGNDYVPDREIGLHYQIHRGIGVHQARANEAGRPLRWSASSSAARPRTRWPR